ncbi:hypothetical protein [Delftia acidovorans]|uniref:hypothetical protein n=1 Tax=Delftia acidovorans TaxID=80866 RepID=UPI0028E326C7|nr:hypothetical protein [Delftia acidovorans]
MAPHINSIITTLDLVLAPISNSQLKIASKNEAAIEIMRSSDFYMIGGRAKATYSKFSSNHTNIINFEIKVLGGASGAGYIEISSIPPIAALEDGAEIEARASEEFLHFYKTEKDGGETLVAAFSPEDILWRKGRKESFIHGLDNHLELACYDLLYAGIATKSDSYSRLIEKGHQARQDILSFEPQRYPGSRVSDEIFLFLFKADPLLLKSWGPDDEITAEDISMQYSNSRLVADAEKAFISILKPPYNSQLYANYPKGKDGIYGQGYTGYSYSLSDGIVFRTAFGSMKGARERHITMSNEADFISVKGDSVELHISGVDYAVNAKAPFK